MRVKVGFVVLFLGLVSLAIVTSTRLSAYPGSTRQTVEQNTQPITKQSESLVTLQPQPTLLGNCVKTASLPLSQQLKLHKCRVRRNDWLDNLFILEKDGKEIGRWAATLSLLDFETFQAFLVDLDDDGNKELVVANHDTSSNGIGIRYWKIYILPDPSTHSFQPPLQFGDEEYGKQGTFVVDGNQFEIWTAEWSGGIIGQQWRYREGQLIPTNHPVLKRWFSFNFEAERAKTYADPRIPYLWLATPKVQAHQEHPLLESTKALSVEDGVIQDIHKECVKNYSGCIDRTVVIFKPNQSKPRSYFYNESGHNYASDDKEKEFFAYFGDWASRRTYPKAYLPSNSKKWLQSRQSKLITYGYKDARSSPTFKILWLMSWD